MSPRLPRLTAGEILSVLQRRGFKIVRSDGSHYLLRDAQFHRVTVPYHGKVILHPKTLKSILKDAGMTVEELVEEK